jgi:hypothetical protein
MRKFQNNSNLKSWHKREMIIADLQANKDFDKTFQRRCSFCICILL